MDLCEQVLVTSIEMISPGSVSCLVTVKLEESFLTLIHIAEYLLNFSSRVSDC